MKTLPIYSIDIYINFVFSFYFPYFVFFFFVLSVFSLNANRYIYIHICSTQKERKRGRYVDKHYVGLQNSLYILSRTSIQLSVQTNQYKFVFCAINERNKKQKISHAFIRIYAQINSVSSCTSHRMQTSKKL